MTARAELLHASDAEIEDAVRYADPMVLRGMLYQLTGDESVSATKVQAVMFFFLELETVTDPADVALLQTKAVDFLKSYRDQGAPELTIGPADRLLRSFSLAVGHEIPESERELWVEQLALDPFARGLRWQQEPPPERRGDFTVGVIGAGMGGLNTAILLKQAGIPYVFFEKNSAVGGTWHENRYPGARIDVPSRAYTHVYSVDFPYPAYFCDQSENEKYFNWLADHYDVRRDIEFDTEVTSVVWDETAGLWEIRATGPDGPRVERVNAVMSGVGLFGRPNVPELPGIGAFEGRAFHTARWPHDVDLEGKRVAVIGTGCTGYQMVPELAKLAGHTYVFQRTPSWCFDVPGYTSPFPDQVSWLDRNFPYHTNFMRYRISWLFGPENVRKFQDVDPDFDDPLARSPLNKLMRDQRIAFMERKFADHPEYVEKMTPATPPMTSRPVVADTEYGIYDALLRDDVTLVTEGIERITERSVVTPDGTEHEVDVIVYATGFRTNDFLWPMEVRGRDGLRVEELWERDGPRAYLGTMLPGFPNFFMLYGPNTNPYSGLSVVDIEEAVTRFMFECVRGLLEQGRRTVDVTPEAYRRFNDEVDRWEKTKIYWEPRAGNYFTNAFGRSSTNCPIDGRLMWALLRSPVDPGPGRVLLDGGSVGDDVDIRPYFGEDLVVE